MNIENNNFISMFSLMKEKYADMRKQHAYFKELSVIDAGSLKRQYLECTDLVAKQELKKKIRDRKDALMMICVVQNQMDTFRKQAQDLLSFFDGDSRMDDDVPEMNQLSKIPAYAVEPEDKSSGYVRNARLRQLMKLYVPMDNDKPVFNEPWEVGPKGRTIQIVGNEVAALYDLVITVPESLDEEYFSSFFNNLRVTKLKPCLQSYLDETGSTKEQFYGMLEYVFRRILPRNRDSRDDPEILSTTEYVSSSEPRVVSERVLERFITDVNKNQVYENESAIRVYPSLAKEYRFVEEMSKWLVLCGYAPIRRKHTKGAKRSMTLYLFKPFSNTEDKNLFIEFVQTLYRDTMYPTQQEQIHEFLLSCQKKQWNPCTETLKQLMSVHIGSDRAEKFVRELNPVQTPHCILKKMILNKKINAFKSNGKGFIMIEEEEEMDIDE